MPDWFDPRPDVVVRPEANARRIWRRRFGTPEIPVGPAVVLANEGGGVFEAVLQELDAVATPVADYRRAGYVHYAYRPPAGGTVTLFRGAEPGPFAAALAEELIVSGARQLLLVGRAGSLAPGVPVGSVVLPGELVREEGTSYHYAPAGVTLSTSPALRERLRLLASRLGVSLVEGKHWTTDALYRETFDKVARLAAQGVVSVDMELASLAGVAHFRRIELAALMIITDVLERNHTWAGMDTEPYRLGVRQAARLAARLFAEGSQASSCPSHSGPS